jgi:hypothetical protein
VVLGLFRCDVSWCFGPEVREPCHSTEHNAKEVGSCRSVETCPAVGKGRECRSAVGGSKGTPAQSGPCGQPAGCFVSVQASYALTQGKSVPWLAVLDSITGRGVWDSRRAKWHWDGCSASTPVLISLTAPSAGPGLTPPQVTRRNAVETCRLRRSEVL